MDLTRKTETKNFKFTLTEIDETEGLFKGYASIFGAIDTMGDQVKKGAFKRSLKEQKKFPMLWSHQVNEPIGIISGKEDDIGLAVEGQLNLDVQRAREVRSLMKQGSVDGLSIGYQTVLEEIDKATNSRVLKEVKLWEISPVVFQACPGAIVTDVKSADGHGDGCHDEAGAWTPVEGCKLCEAMIRIAQDAASALEAKKKAEADEGTGTDLISTLDALILQGKGKTDELHLLDLLTFKI